MDAEIVVVGHVHRVARPVPRGDLVLVDPRPARQGCVLVGGPLPQERDRACRVPHGEAGHDVRVEVVVDDGRVLVGTGHPVDVEALLAVDRVEAEVLVEACGLDEDLGALVREELDVARRVEVPLERVHDRCVDVVLRGAGCVVGRRLLTVDRPPRVQRPPLAQLGGTGARRAEHVVPEPEQLAGRVGVGVGEVRQDVHLGVPEVVPVVAAGGHALGRDPLLVRPRRCLGELEQVPPDGLLGRWIAGDLDVAVRPEVVEPRLLFGAERREPFLASPVDGAVATVGELLGGDAA